MLKRRDIPVRNRALQKTLKKHGVQLVLAEYGMVGASVRKACEEIHVPLIIHFHGMDAHRYQLLQEYEQEYLQAFRYAAALVAVSQTMQKQLIRLGAPTEKVHLIPYGIDLAYFQPPAFPTTGLHIVSIGRMVEKKAPLNTIRAFAIMARKFPDARLSMVGNGPLLDDAKRLAEKLGLSERIDFPGVLNKDQVRDLLCTAFAYVQHSVRAEDGDMEGTPNTILEAAAMALPIVSTRHAGIQEAVLEDKTGLLVSEHAIDEMGKSLIFLAENRSRAHQMGLEGRKHVEKNYELHTQLEKLDALISVHKKSFSE